MIDKKEYMKRYYEENKDRMRQQCREWYARNKEHIREYDDRTREKKKERQRRWCAKKRDELKNLIQNKAIIEVDTKPKKSCGRPRIHPDIVLEPKEKKPRGRPKTSVIERKRKTIERNLEELQKRADAFKLSLQGIDADKSGKSKGDQTT